MNAAAVDPGAVGEALRLELVRHLPRSAVYAAVLTCAVMKGATASQAARALLVAARVAQPEPAVQPLRPLPGWRLQWERGVVASLAALLGCSEGEAGDVLEVWTPALAYMALGPGDCVPPEAAAAAIEAAAAQVRP